MATPEELHDAVVRIGRSNPRSVKATVVASANFGCSVQLHAEVRQTNITIHLEVRYQEVNCGR
jgi:hypothetical protein